MTQEEYVAKVMTAPPMNKLEVAFDVFIAVVSIVFGIYFGLYSGDKP